MNDIRTNLAQSVQEWIVNEMKYSQEGSKSKVPSVYEIKNLCRGSSIHVWRFLIERVKSEVNVKTIRQNIEIYNNKKLNDREQLQKKKTKEFLLNRKEFLEQQLLKTQGDIDKVQLDISYIKKEMCDYNKEMDQIKERIREITNRLTLTKASIKKSDIFISILKEYQSRLKKNINNIKNNLNDATSIRRMTIFDQNLSIRPLKESEKSKKDSEKMKDLLNESLDAIKAWFTKSLLNRNDCSLDSLIRNDIFNDSAFINSVPFINKDTLKKESPKMIIDALSSLIRHDSNHLQIGDSQLGALDVLKNKLNEEFAIFSSSLQRLYRSNSNTTVQNILGQQREDHFNKFISTERILNECHAIKQINDKMMRSLNLYEEEAVDRTPPNYKHNNRLSSYQYLNHLEVLIASEKAALAQTNIIIQQLNENLIHYENASLLLKDKFELIQECEDFNKELLNTVNYITKTMRHYKKVVENKIRSLKEIISHRVLPLKYEDTRGIVNDLALFINRDVQVSSDIPLRYYHYHHFFSQNNENSITSLNLRDENCLYINMVQFILSTLDVPQYKSYDHIVDYIINYMRRIEYCNRIIEMKKKTTSNSKAKLNQLNNEDIISLYQEKWNDFLKLQEDHWIPSLVDSIKQCKNALEKCKHVKTLLDEWWNQPAQHLVTWIVNKEGKSFSECLNEWKELSHQIHNSKNQQI